MTMTEATQQFLSHQESLGRSPETIRSYGKLLEMFNKYLSKKNNGQVYVDSITADDLEEYLRDEYGKDSCSSSFRFNMINAFKGLMGFCYMKGCCSDNIAKKVRQIKRRVKEREYLTGDEFERVVARISHKLIRTAVQTMYYAGLRINECINLSLADVDFDRNCITVRDDKEKHTRIIPINHKLRVNLQDYLERVRNHKDSVRFFATRTGKLSANYVNHALKEAAVAAGTTQHVTCHILRHSFASNLISKGVDIHKVRRLLGHTNLKSTSIYLHSNLVELRKSLNKLQ